MPHIELSYETDGEDWYAVVNGVRQIRPFYTQEAAQRVAELSLWRYMPIG